MTYSSDFGRQVLSVREKEGLPIGQVARRFDVGVGSVVGFKAPKAEGWPKVDGYRRRKIDMDALARDSEHYPDASQSKRGARFGVHQNVIWTPLKTSPFWMISDSMVSSH